MDKAQELLIYNWLKSKCNRTGYWLPAMVVVGVVHCLLVVAQAWAIAITVDEFRISSLNFTNHFVPVLIFFGAAFLRALSLWLREWIGFELGARVRSDIRKLLLDKINRLGPLSVKAYPEGQWLTALFDQVECLHGFFAYYLAQVYIAIIVPFLIIVLIYPIDWLVACVFAFTAPLIPIFMILVGVKAADKSRENAIELTRLNGYFLNIIQGLTTLRWFGVSKKEADNVEKKTDALRKKTMDVLRLAFLSSTVLEFFSTMAIALIAVYFGFGYLGYLNHPEYWGSVTLFSGIYILMIAPEFYKPLRDLGTYYHARADAIGAGERIMHLAEVSVPKKMQGTVSCYKRSAAEISLKHVTVSAPIDGRILLQDITLDIAVGEHCLIKGASGAGKTTLLLTLLGLTEFSGTISINGQSVAALNLDSWRQRIAWLGQNPRLIHGSILENVLLGVNRFTSNTRAVLEEVLMEAGAWSFVQHLPYKEHTVVGESGFGLSVGQAQRIALARALARKDAQIVILDEPFSSLDDLNKNIMQSCIRRFSKNKTLVMVDHDNSTLMKIDRTFSLRDGRLF